MGKRKDLIKGLHSVEEALDSGHPLRKVFIQKGLHDEKLKNLINNFREQEVPFQYVPKEKLNKLSGNHQGIIALSSPIEFERIENLVPLFFEQGKSPLLCILDGVTDVRNFGAIARSAEFLGVDALIIPTRGASDINEDAVKTSAGALLKVPVCREQNLIQAIAYLKDSGFQIVAASEKNRIPLGKVDLTTPTAIVMGAEDTGISKDILQACTHHALIPKTGNLDSLNVSVAAGIFFYEAWRQRQLA